MPENRDNVGIKMKTDTSKNQYETGDIISWCDETYRIRESFGDSGIVEYLDGELATNNFYFSYGGEKAVIISKCEE